MVHSYTKWKIPEVHICSEKILNLPFGFLAFMVRINKFHKLYVSSTYFLEFYSLPDKTIGIIFMDKLVDRAFV